MILLGKPVLEAFETKARTHLSRGKLASVALCDSHYDVLPIYHPVHIYPGSAQENRQTFEELGDELRALLANLENSSDVANPQ